MLKGILTTKDETIPQTYLTCANDSTEYTSWSWLTPGHTWAISVWTIPWYSGSVLPYHCCRDLANKIVSNTFTNIYLDFHEKAGLSCPNTHAKIYLIIQFTCKWRHISDTLEHSQTKHILRGQWLNPPWTMMLSAQQYIFFVYKISVCDFVWQKLI